MQSREYGIMGTRKDWSSCACVCVVMCAAATTSLMLCVCIMSVFLCVKWTGIYMKKYILQLQKGMQRRFDSLNLSK